MFQEKFMKIKKTQKIPIYKYVNSRRYSENRKNAGQSSVPLMSFIGARRKTP